MCVEILRYTFLLNYSGRKGDGTNKKSARLSESDISETDLDDPQPSTSVDIEGVSDQSTSTSPGPSIISG